MASLAALSVGAARAADPKSVAFVPQLVGIPYFDAMQAGGKKAAAELGVTFTYSGPVDTNPVDQLQIVQNLINQGVNAIAVSVLDASSIQPVVAAAKAKGVTLFTSDSDAADSGRPVYVAQASDQGPGEAMVDEVVKRAGPSFKVGIVSGEATVSNLNAWIGFMQRRAAAKYPGLKLLAPQCAGGTAERASQVVGDLMAADPDLKGIIGVASTTCPVVGQAIETAGKVGTVVGAGYRSPNTVRAYLKSGSFGCSVLWDPSALGYLTVWAGKQLIDGTPFKPSNDVPGSVRDAEKVCTATHGSFAVIVPNRRSAVVGGAALRFAVARSARAAPPTFAMVQYNEQALFFVQMRQARRTRRRRPGCSSTCSTRTTARPTRTARSRPTSRRSPAS